jgi:hypothetical protein
LGEIDVIQGEADSTGVPQKQSIVTNLSLLRRHLPLPRVLGDAWACITKLFKAVNNSMQWYVSVRHLHATLIFGGFKWSPVRGGARVGINYVRKEFFEKGPLVRMNY